MMTKLHFVFALLFVTGINFGQTDNSISPPNFKEKIPVGTMVYTAEKVNNETEKTKANLALLEAGDKMLRFGKELETNLDFFALAEHFVQPNGHTIYQLGINCFSAKSINLILNEFELADGAHLFLTDKYTKAYIGAYTSANNNEAKVLGTELLKSDFIYLVLDEPGITAKPSNFKIQTVVHGFEDLEEMAKGLNTSGNCNYDVNCPIGVGYELQRNSVAMMVSGGGFCTGSLVNNTSGTIIPYFISARHCGINPTNWVFRFRWEADASGAVCASTSPSPNGPQTMNVNGGVLKAQNSTSDFILVRLNSNPDPSWGIYYNGWDNTDVMNATKGIGIHHPDGDIKKICIEEDALGQQTITFQSALNRTWLISNWDYGVTQPGSSGSPLFNQDKRLIGVLSGGLAACNGLDDNNQPDYYGRFGYAWNNSTSASGRLVDWLDSTGTGATIIDGVDPAIGNDVVDASLSSLSGLPASKCDSIATPSFILLNSGTNNLTTVDFSYGFIGQTPLTFTWNGNIPTYGQATVNLPSLIAPLGNSVFEVNVVGANGAADLDATNNVLSIPFYRLQPDFTARLTLDLDCYGSETTWLLTDSLGVTIYSDGPYSDSMPGILTYDLCLSNACYSFIINDAYGDGLSGCSPPDGGFGSYKLVNLNNGVTLAQLLEVNADFGSQYVQTFCTGVWGIDELNLGNLVSLYPNPGTNSLSIQTETVQLKEIEVLTLTGTKVLSKIVSGHHTELNTSDLPAAFYLVRIKTDKGETVQRWVKQ
jgi:hypothetical protein